MNRTISIRKSTFARICLAGCVCTTLSAVYAAADEPIDFDRNIAPLLAQKCLTCHDAREKKGGLDLSSRKTAFAGGDSGEALAPRSPEDSYLWHRIRDDEMPPKHPLAADEKEILRRWIAQGAKWGSDPIDPFRFTTAKRAGYNWWSLRPLAKSHPPEIAGAEIRNPVDAYIRDRLRQAELSPAPEADRRTLIRRLSFDLLGLPPTPDQVREFLADDSPHAYAELVDRLLASQHFGERWARHWLDVVRYGESQGFERDKIRPNSWRYRDWVIDAFNRDMPYDQFARLQLAGDVLHPDDADAITATGFLVAGAYDEVGQSQQSAAMRAVVRQDEMEDIVGTVGQTFLGLTVNCARCHDHKFDPIRQSEYYRLVSALSGVRHGERSLRIPENERKVRQLEPLLAALRDKIADALERTRQKVLADRKQQPRPAPPAPTARWTFDVGFEDEIGNLDLKPSGGARLESGRLVLDGKKAYAASGPLPVNLKEKTLEAWVQLDNLNQRGGGVISVQTLDGVLFDAIVFGEKNAGQWMAGSNNFLRTMPFHGPQENDAANELVHVAIVYRADGTIAAYRNGLPYGTEYRSKALQPFEARKTQVLIGLRHGTSAGGNRMLAGRIDQAQLYDRALTPEEIAASAGRADYVSRDEILAAMSTAERKQLSDWQAQSDKLAGRIADLKNPKVYAVTPRPPEVTHLLLRGSTLSPAEVVSPGGIASLPGPSADFGLPPDAPEGERRKKLAEWIASKDNPLFARTIVNRLWHYHFGVGLVDSPNDFGFNGGRPSHPELLDFLANYLIESRWSLKALHRLIVTSETYRQSSRPREDALRADAGNRLLWRYSPQRLDAETLRDAMLDVAGQLNPQYGGPSYRDFKTFSFNSQFYEMYDPVGFEFNRRTIYRTWLRSGRNRFLDAFDCPDPSTTAPKRAVTTTPTQSLSLLNNSFVLRMADRLAKRAADAAGTDPAKQIQSVYQFLYQRDPSPDELALVKQFTAAHGLPALCRVLFNSNEFLYVE